MCSLWHYSYVIFLISFIADPLLRPSGQTSAAPVLCYPTYGCYDPRPGFSKYPESPAKINTTFFLYTRESSPSGQIITETDLGAFDPQKPIKVITHGFTDRASNKWVIQMKDEFLQSEDVNVVAVDWSRGNQFPYDQAVANTVVTAAVIKQLLQEMIRVGAQPNQIHLIGHSLGAHISGYVGQLLPGLGRITGLDPAGPDFYKSETADRLDPSDAQFVDVIHTDVADRMHEGFGHRDALGHVDFYPNNGAAQPTCGKNTADVLFQAMGSLLGTLNLGNALDSVACNHMSAVYYFINSINSSPSVIGYPCSDYKSFEAGECTSCGLSPSRCQPMGYHASLSRTLGKLYLKTLHGTKAPFFGTHLKVTVASDEDNEPQTQGTATLRFNGLPYISLFNQDTRMTPNFQKSTVILLPSTSLPSNEISVSFQKSYNAFWNRDLADQWRFSSVTMVEMESTRSHKFCPTSDAKIKSGTFLTFRAC